VKKIFIDAQDLLYDSFLLAKKVFDSNFQADFIIGVWRGGAPVGIAIQEYFEYAGIKTDHVAIKTSSYTGIDQQSKKIQVDSLEYILNNINKHSRVLIVDDVFDSGRSIEAILERLKQETKDNYPTEIKVACPWFKPARNQTKLSPDYFIHQTDNWLVFPHEIVGLSDAELKDGKGKLFNTLPKP